MATLRVRYRTGDTDEWELHDRLQLKELGEHIHGNLHGDKVVAFSVASRLSEVPSDFAFIWLRLNDIVMLEVDGYVDDEMLAAVWELP